MGVMPEALEKSLSARAKLFWGSLAVCASSAVAHSFSPAPLLPYSVLFIVALNGFYLSGVLLLSGKPGRKNKPALSKDSKWPSVSIIIPAHNEETVIRRTVLNMMEIDYPDYDILVIDDRSSDSTAHVLEALKKELRSEAADHVRFHTRPSESTPGKSAVLNDGLAMTQGEIIAVFDADAIVKPDFLKALVPYLEEEQNAAVQAGKVIANAGDGLLTLCQDMEYALDSLLQEGRAGTGGAAELRGNGQLVRREALNGVGGWNEETVTDDLDLSTRLHSAGYKIGFVPETKVYEEGVTAFYPLVRQRLRWAKGSLYRYLDHTASLIRSKKTSRRTRSDALIYALYFMLPAFLFLDAMAAVPYRESGGRAVVMLSLFSDTLFLLWALSLLPLALAAKKMRNIPYPRAIFLVPLTAFYLLLWLPVVLYVYSKALLFPDKVLKWDKTHHGESQAALENMTGRS